MMPRHLFQFLIWFVIAFLATWGLIDLLTP